MKAEIREAWRSALVSGEWQQGKGKLAKKNPDGTWRYCCLGVLCELAVQAGVQLNVTEMCDDDPETVFRFYNGEHGFLPPEVQQWSGLCDRNPAVDHPSDLAMAYLNDSLGTTFAELAEVLPL